MKLKKSLLALAISATLATMGLTGCGSSSSDNITTGGATGVDPAAQVNNTPIFSMVSNNGTGNQGQVDLFDRLFSPLFTATSGNNQGVAFDSLRNLYHAGDVGNPSIRTFGRFVDRIATNNNTFNTQFDRELVGASTGLVSPKGFAIAHKGGFTIVADFGASNIKVFGTTASGNNPPVATTPLAGNAPWDVAYDETNDRLYVASTAGSILVFDDYIANGFAATGTPNRTITPIRANAAALVNMHGIAFDSGRNAIVVSDVGAANTGQAADFATDGKIYVFNNASTASGNVTADITIEGPLSELGNPVDIDLFGDDLRVAEKANGKLLIFADIFAAATGDRRATVSVAEVGPESVATTVTAINAPTDASDFDNLATFTGVIASGNNGTVGNNLKRFSQDLGTTQSDFSTLIVDTEGARADSLGDVYVAGNDRIAVYNRAATSRNGSLANTSRDRTISGANTTLVSAKGLDIVESKNWILVADLGGDAIKVFSKEASGDVAPLFTVAASGINGAGPWDVDYDPATDRAFVAMTDGTVFVYDNFSAGATTAITAPNRTIDPNPNAGPNDAVASNLHGIVYDAANGVLLLSDVGDTSSLSDGSIYVVVLGNAANANGTITPFRTITGANTRLGNPVDLAYNGTDLYVAEKANGGEIQRIANVRGTSGTTNTAPDNTVAVAGAESVSINVHAPYTP